MQKAAETTATACKHAPNTSRCQDKIMWPVSARKQMLQKC